MPAVTNGAVEHIPQGMNHVQVQLFGWARVGAGGVAEDKVVFTYEVNGIFNLFQGGHTGRDDKGLASSTVGTQQGLIRKQGAGEFVGWRVKSFNKLNGRYIP